MLPRLVIEMERIANDEMLHRDYNYSLYESQVTQPLYAERSDGEVVPALLGDAIRVSDQEWVFGAGPKLPGTSGNELSDIAQGIAQKVSKNHSSTWLGRLIKRVTVHGAQLRIHTRFPIAALPAMLTAQSLAFGVVGGRRIGDFQLATKHDRASSTILKATDQRFEVELADFGTREKGRKKFFAGDIDIGWGVGLPRAFYETDPGPFVEPVNFNINYVLSAGSGLSPQLWKNIESCLEENPVTAPYLSTTGSRFSGVFQNDALQLLPAEESRRSSASDTVTAGTSVPLYFSKYDPNGDLAQVIAEQAQGLLYPVQVNYEDIVMNRVKSDGALLSLRVPINSSPLGALPETLGYLRPHDTTTDPSAELSKMILEILARKDPSHGRMEYLEKTVNKMKRQITIGRLRVLFRSSISFETNSMGVFSFRDLEGTINAY